MSLFLSNILLSSRHGSQPWSLSASLCLKSLRLLRLPTSNYWYRAVLQSTRSLSWLAALCVSVLLMCWELHSGRIFLFSKSEERKCAGVNSSVGRQKNLWKYEFRLEEESLISRSGSLLLFLSTGIFTAEISDKHICDNLLEFRQIVFYKWSRFSLIWSNF